MNRSRRASGLLLLATSCAACAASSDAPAPAPDSGTHATAIPPNGSAPAIASPPTHPTPAAALLVLAKRDETLAIVDPTSLEILAKIPVGHDPHEVVASADGALAYVSNYGHGTFNTLARVDLVAQTALTAIDLGALKGPHGLAYVGGKVWFTAEGAKVVGDYDPASSTIDLVIGTGQDRTHMIDVAPDLKRIITTNVSSGTISFLEKIERPQGPPPMFDGGAFRPPPPSSPSSSSAPFPPPGPHLDWEQTLVQVGVGTEGFDLAPNGAELWAADAQDGTIAVVDVAKKTVTKKIAANVRGANRLKFTVDGKSVLVSTLRGADLVVFDAQARAESKRIPIGTGAAGIQIDPSGARAFVACSPDNDVAVIDLKTMSVVGRINAGTEPDGMAWATRSAR